MQAQMDPRNPSPFKQPFLALEVQNKENEEEWLIDVDGEVGKYVESEKPTEMLLALCEMMESVGYKVSHFRTYTGGSGPSHILRNGALFERMSDTFEQEPERPTFRASV